MQDETHGRKLHAKTVEAWSLYKALYKPAYSMGICCPAVKMHTRTDRRLFGSHDPLRASAWQHYAQHECLLPRCHQHAQQHRHTRVDARNKR